MDEGIILNDILQRTRFKWMERVILMSHDLVLHPTILMNVDVNRVPGIYIHATHPLLTWLGPENPVISGWSLPLTNVLYDESSSFGSSCEGSNHLKVAADERDAFYPSDGGFTHFLAFSPRKLGKWSILTRNIFQMAWNHQLVSTLQEFSLLLIREYWYLMTTSLHEMVLSFLQPGVPV